MRPTFQQCCTTWNPMLVFDHFQLNLVRLLQAVDSVAQPLRLIPSIDPDFPEARDAGGKIAHVKARCRCRVIPLVATARGAERPWTSRGQQYRPARPLRWAHRRRPHSPHGGVAPVPGHTRPHEYSRTATFCASRLRNDVL